jgi:DNA-binding GntR family transcriptional regulator
MTAPQPGNPVTAEWAASPAAARQLAAALARELQAASPDDPVDSTQKIAALFTVSRSVATDARNLLIGQGIIRQRGRHYYPA